MTISSSLNAGVAGLASNASRLASISDNIANSATFGYKRVEADFQSMVAGSAGGKYTAGGVRVSTQRLVDQGGSLTATSNPTDLAVRGRGFLPVTSLNDAAKGDPQMMLTTTGSFRTDADGYLVTNSGLVLMGWPASADGTIPSYPRDTSDRLEPIRINTNQLSGEPTTRMSLGVNLPATETNFDALGGPYETTIEYYDNLGVSETIVATFSPTRLASGSSNMWTVELTDSAQGGAIIGKYDLTFNNSRDAGGTLASVTKVPTDPGGEWGDVTAGSVVVDVAGGPMEIFFGEKDSKTGLTQLAGSFAPLNISKDGSPVGNMTSVEVDGQGMVQAYFDTGLTRTIFQVPLVDLPNPNGLLAMDRQTYLPSTTSGSFFLWDASDGPTGDIVSFAREESTTDVAAELTSLIQTQRAYSSNAKVIQTVDEMLQETTNIKR